MRILASALLLWSALAAEEGSSSSAGPPFLLIDSTDQLCLSGEEFKRCSIDTLWYVSGSPGSYQIHKRPVGGEEAEEEDGDCVSLQSCKDEDVGQLMQARLAKCSHCGAKNWNILGDAEQGYILSEGDNRSCLLREPGTNKAMTAPCDSTEHGYTPLQLQFASPTDIETMSSEGARMIGAASDGDAQAIQELLNSGVEVNVRDWDQLTALVPAASSGHLDVCKILVEKGVDVNAKDKDGITALMEASIMGHSAVVEFLLESGASVHEAASSGVTALWLAASEGRVDVMRVLLGKGADATNARVDGITALMTASAGGHAEAVGLLLENGADASQVDKDGLTPLLNAAEKGSVETMKLLIENVEDENYVNLMSNTGFNAIIIASAHGHVDAVNYLIEIGCDVNAVHVNKVSALMYAAASGHVETMKALIDNGKADLEVKHTNGGTALLEASTGGMLGAVELLMSKGAEIDFVDDDGVSPLMAVASQGNAEAQALLLGGLKKRMSADQLTEHINRLSDSGGSSVMYAAAGGHVECAKQLMELGADIKAIAQAKPGYAEKLQKMIEEGQVVDEDPHVDGVTGLHVAAQGGHLEMVKVLLDAGADVTVKDEAGRTALVMAIAGSHKDIATALVAAGSDPNTPYVDEKGEAHNLLFDSIVVENEDFALMLIEKGASIYHKDEKNVNSLLQASHRGFSAIVKALIDKNGGKDRYIDAASEEGITALIAAASEGHVDCVKLLLEAGANANAMDKDGTNSLMAASARGHVNVVAGLLEAGAAVNEQNDDGHTALMFAYNGKNQVETLWERYNQFVEEAKSNGESLDSAEDNETGPIIKEALENHSALVELLLKNEADPKMKDKEGHVAADFDFHPDTDAEVLAKHAKAAKAKDESKNEL